MLQRAGFELLQVVSVTITSAVVLCRLRCVWCYCRGLSYTEEGKVVVVVVGSAGGGGGGGSVGSGGSGGQGGDGGGGGESVSSGIGGGC